MRRLLVRLSLLAIAALGIAAAPTGGGGERGPQRRPAAVSGEDASNARVIVKYRAGSSLMRPLAAARVGPRPQHAAALGRRLSLPLVDGRVLGARTQAMRGVGLSSSQLAERLAAQPDVEWAVPDRRRRISAAPNDPLFGPGQTTVTPAAGQWYLRAPDASTPSAINAVGAWELTPGDSSITVAVLDTGVRFDHPDLAGKLHPGYDFVRDAPTANDGNGRDADASDPGDWTTAGECGHGEAASDSSWHGTQVAGIVGAATDNGQGIASVGRKVMVLPVRVLGRCGGFDSDIIAAMRWAAGIGADPGVNPHPARVINLSLGSSGPCEAPYREAIVELNAAQVTVVAAAGNETGLAVDTPANCPGVIAVAGVRHAGTKVGYSNLGPEIAISAPAGNCVNLTGTCLYPLVTTTNSGLTAPGAHVYTDGGDTATLGTSFSSPIVAGTVGLLLSVKPALTPTQVRSALQASARPFPGSGSEPGTPVCRAPDGVDQLECYCTTGTCGAGLLDAAAALALVAPAQVPAPTVAIGAPSATLAVGASTTLAAQNATAFGGRTIVGYRWTITAGAASASLTGAADGAAATVVGAAPGSVVVTLTVTDSAGATGTSAFEITVTAPVQPPAPGGTGGGAVGLPWIAGLLAAVWGLRRRPSGHSINRSARTTID